MIDIFVQRNPGDRRGEDIISPLITELSVALSRGQVECDRNAPARTMQLDVTFRLGLMTGQTVQIVDSLQGQVWVGKITAIDNGVENAKVYTRLTIERFI